MGRKNRQRVGPRMFIYPESSKPFKKVVSGISELMHQDKDKLGKGQDAVDKDMRGIRILRVERLDNSPLAISYASYRTKMIQQLNNKNYNKDISDLFSTKENIRSKGDVKTRIMKNPTTQNPLREEANEVFLFHGCSSDAAEGIKQKGFDKYCSSKNDMFGQANYFAESPVKADQYAGIAI